MFEQEISTEIRARFFHVTLAAYLLNAYAAKPKSVMRDASASLFFRIIVNTDKTSIFKSYGNLRFYSVYNTYVLR